MRLARFDTCSFCRIGKCSVVIVAVKNVSATFESAGPAENGNAFIATARALRRSCVRIELDVVCNEQVEPTVSIVIPESRTCAVSAFADLRVVGHIREGAVPVVAIKRVTPGIRY